MLTAIFSHLLTSIQSLHFYKPEDKPKPTIKKDLNHVISILNFKDGIDGGGAPKLLLNSRILETSS